MTRAMCHFNTCKFKKMMEARIIGLKLIFVSILSI